MADTAFVMKRSINIGERVRIHPASDWFMRGVTHGIVTSKRVTADGSAVVYYLRPDTAGIQTRATLRMKLHRDNIIADPFNDCDCGEDR